MLLSVNKTCCRFQGVDELKYIGRLEPLNYSEVSVLLSETVNSQNSESHNSIVEGLNDFWNELDRRAWFQESIYIVYESFLQ